MSYKLFKSIWWLVICTNFTKYTVSSNVQDFCEFWPNRDKPDAEIHKEMRNITKIMSSENIQLPLEAFTTDSKFIEQFENEFNDTIKGFRLKWHTNIREVYTILIKNYLPKSLGCIYKQNYHIAAFEDKLNVTVSEIVQQVTDSVFNDVAFIRDCVSLPTIIVEESSGENFGCFFGELSTSSRYVLMLCLVAPLHEANARPTRILKMKKACGTGQELVFNDFFVISNQREELQTTTPNPIEELDRNNFNITSNKMVNITANERWQPLFNNAHFHCHNCTINLIMGN